MTWDQRQECLKSIVAEHGIDRPADGWNPVILTWVDRAGYSVTPAEIASLIGTLIALHRKKGRPTPREPDVPHEARPLPEGQRRVIRKTLDE